MPDPVRAIGYVFAYCGKRPKTRLEFLSLPAAHAQYSHMLVAQRSGKLHLNKILEDTTTDRRSSFFNRRSFKVAVAQAKQQDCVLAVGQISILLSTVKPDKVEELIEVLRELPVDIWVANLGGYWSSFSAQYRTKIVMDAVRVQQHHSVAIKTGLRNAKPKKNAAPGGANWRKGVQANAGRAERLAAGLAPIVQEEMKKLAPGERLSPAKLSKLLNAQGVPAPRGGEWSYNSAKNLLARITRAGLQDTEK